MNVMKKKVFFDMDGVLVNFESALDKVDPELLSQFEGHLEDIPGIFSKMEPIPGALDAVRKISENYDVYILSTAPWNNPSGWADKIAWVHQYAEDIFKKRVILSHCKDLCIGDYIVDDRDRHGVRSFQGKWIHFRSDEFPDWDSVVRYFDKENKDDIALIRLNKFMNDTKKTDDTNSQKKEFSK